MCGRPGNVDVFFVWTLLNECKRNEANEISMSIENGIPGILNKCSSNFRYVEFGVRQGRILSPFLFDFNINNILDSVYFSL